MALDGVIRIMEVIGVTLDGVIQDLLITIADALRIRLGTMQERQEMPKDAPEKLKHVSDEIKEKCNKALKKGFL
jgi:hypothetical protein